MINSSASVRDSLAGEDTHIPLADLGAQYRSIQGEIDAAMRRVVEHSRFILGPEVAAFEADFAAYCAVPFAIGVASGTAAIALILAAYGIGAGDEVITTAHTFVATAEPIALAGARPVFVDIDPRTYNLNVELVEAAITPRTRAIMPVHLYGQPADMGRLRALADQYRLPLIEDAAQAHGAEWQGKRVGSLGDAAAFSFYPGKNLGAYGDAGMVTTTNQAIANRIRLLRDHGRANKYEHHMLGYGERLDALQAAILSVKLRHLEVWTHARRTLAMRYNLLLGDAKLPSAVLPYEPTHVRAVYHLYVIRVPQRDRVVQALKAHQIEAGIHYPLPLHLQPCFAYLGYPSGSLPETEKAAAEVVSLPLYAEMTPQQQESVVRVLADIIHSL